MFKKLSWDRQATRKTQINLEMKTAMFEKNKLDRIKSRLDTAKQKINELEDI